MLYPVGTQRAASAKKQNKQKYNMLDPVGTQRAASAKKTNK